ncbi:hypothetical protein PTR01_21425 [Serratia bockelmannii]|uniref:hypothetical protein n=1 Tax=Serratia bockelmannii TaxID=2703793 RepID=UPI00313F0317
MQFKDLPEYAKQAACNALSNRIIKNPYDKGEAKAIRDAFIALYSEPENAGEYENLDSVVKEATCSILCKKYSPCGTHVGSVYIVVEDDASEEALIGKFKNLFLYAPKGMKGMTVSQYKSESEHEPEETNKMSSVERLLLVNSIANAIISTVKETQKPVGSHDFEQAIKSVREMCTPGI